MNITFELQQLDDLIIKHTQPPVTAVLRNKLHPLREQMEAYVTDKEKVTELLKQEQATNAQVTAENQKLVATNAKLVAQNQAAQAQPMRFVQEVVEDTPEDILRRGFNC